MLNYDTLLSVLMDKFRADEVDIELIGDVKIQEWKANRKQFGYIHAVIFPHIAQAYRDAGWQGFDDYDAKFKLKQMFFSKERVNEKNGEVFTVPMSLAEADKDDMSAFIQDCIQFAAEVFGIEIPDSKEYLKNKKKQQQII